MRKTACLCLTAAALCLLALPAAAGEAPPPEPAVDLQPVEVLDLDGLQTDDEGECEAPAAAVGTPEPVFLAGEQCGAVVCGKGKYCCNFSCSLCVFHGMSCTQQVC